MDTLALLLNSGKTVFSSDDLGFLLGLSHPQSLRNMLSKLGSREILVPLAYGLRGFRAYDRYELSAKLQKPSYVSLHTVLYHHGIIYQEYGNTISCLSNNTITKQADGYVFEYRKIKDALLYNPQGIEQKKHYMIASAPRALCDTLYLDPRASFDSLEYINKETVIQLAMIYPLFVQKAVVRLFNSSH